MVNKAVFTKSVLNARSLLLIGVLLTLCISEGVGLQLLPFPTVSGEHSLAESFHIKGDGNCSSAPSHTQYIPCRVEMVAPKLKERSLRQQIEPVVVALVISHLVVADSLHSIYLEHPPSFYSLTLDCQTSGRAPPSLACL